MNQVLQPLKYALLIAIGILIGIWFVPFKTSGGNKISQILQIIKNNYVDTINTEVLEKESISDLLHSLDPHSNYFTAVEAKQANEPLNGSFDGIGIEYLLWGDTIFVANVIDDGPSFKAGLKVGDKIIQVEEKVLQGMKLSNSDVLGLLKGKSGSEVQIKVFRNSESQIKDFKIVRGSIPIKSVEAYFMADNVTGYIKISRFGANTFDEYKDAFEALKSSGMKNLILDLRDNGGGYLNTAQKIADEFLSADKKILTTRGEHTGEENYVATATGSFERGKLIVLMNENSASASEILGGALQDNDRAIIIGRRSFGKGLVQNSFSLKDGSSIRLTISRYYTPSGRSIQRPYNHGYGEYEEDFSNRYRSGELFVEDSIKNNATQSYLTIGGRKVFGGGGIVPDFFVPLDTSQNSIFLTSLLEKSVIRQVAYSFSEKNGSELKRFANVMQFKTEFKVDALLWEQLKVAAGYTQIVWDEKEAVRSQLEIEKYLKSFIAKQLFKNNGYFYIENKGDPTFEKALECMSNEMYFDKLVK